jgi:hypothetical protein
MGIFKSLVRAATEPFRQTSHAAERIVRAVVHNPVQAVARVSPIAVAAATANPWAVAAAAAASSALNGGNTRQNLAAATMSGLGSHLGGGLGTRVGGLERLARRNQRGSGFGNASCQRCAK